MDFTSLTSAVDLSGAVTAILGVAAVLVLPKVAIRGWRFISRMF